MTNSSPKSSPKKLEDLPTRTVMTAFEKTSYYTNAPAVGFGTGSRPPLYRYIYSHSLHILLHTYLFAHSLALVVVQDQAHTQ